MGGEDLGCDGVLVDVDEGTVTVRKSIISSHAYSKPGTRVEKLRTRKHKGIEKLRRLPRMPSISSR